MIVVVCFLCLNFFPCGHDARFLFLIIKRKVIGAEFISVYFASRLLVIFILIFEKASLGILKCSFACLFPHLFPSSNRRHQHSIRSIIAATLPCERALSISEIESPSLKRRPHLPNGSPCYPKLII